MYPDSAARRSRMALPITALAVALTLAGCTVGASGSSSEPLPTGSGAAASGVTRPAWLDDELTEVSTGQSFRIADFAGQVVLLETMATWCPTCRQQGNEVKKLHEALGSFDTVVSVSLDVDPNEDEALLAKYAAGSSFGWRFAVAPKQLGSDLAALYGPNFLNPPYAPMLIVDRGQVVHPLPDYLKSADSLRQALDPYLAAQ
jgi:cytochrome oxidase Cu insertion factor (SCO1/SenC/PrrC family)